MREGYRRRWMLVLVLLLMGLALLACGARERATEQADERAAQLAGVTPLPTHVFEQPTTIITVAATPTEEVDLERGKRLYEDRGCAGCHGAQGEGVEGKAKGLAGTPLTEEEFTDILRTGGNGELGNEHLYGLYGPQAISISGMKALYAYVKSFPTQ